MDGKTLRLIKSIKENRRKHSRKTETLDLRIFMQKYIWFGMATQAFITAGLTSVNIIKPSVGQQICAGVLFILAITILEVRKKLRRKTFQGITQLNIFSTTSEERNGIMYQPAPTCPMIDTLKSKVDEKYHDELEAIREHVKNIREWGQQWKNNALEREW